MINMAKKVYAIKEGYDSKLNRKIENIIVNTWNECLKYVKGVKGAKYKSFEDIDSAKSYLNDNNKLLKKGNDSYPEDCLHLYVDGSYNIATKRYAYGVVAVRNNIIEYIDGYSPIDISQSSIRQIAGELDGAIKAMEYALEKGDKRVVLFHDYEGIFHHATGSWERKDESSLKYYNMMNNFFKQGIEVIFVKVDSHTGDLYNELVDEVCKSRLEIDSDKVVEKWLANNKLYVCNEKVKNEVLKLASNRDKNIIIKEELTHIPDKINNSIKSNDMIIDESGIVEELIRIMEGLSEEKKIEILKYAKYINNQ